MLRDAAAAIMGAMVDPNADSRAVSSAAFAHVQGLPDHRRVLEAVLAHFRPSAVGAWVSGSVARGGMDEESDVDVGICFGSEAERQAAWEMRQDWEIAPWFHRFDADHVKPFFVIYLFSPKVKTDIPLYTLDNLPAPDGGPYVLAWDDTGRLREWAKAAVPAGDPVDWSPAIHEEERFWAWLVYSLQHVRRGELYSTASDFAALRDIVEQWHARLDGRSRFSTRRAEQLGDTSELAELFPRPEHGSLKHALLKLIAIHDRQRAELDLPWRTAEAARERIRRWVEEL
jgi:predicted nucleotidyltransferase